MIRHECGYEEPAYCKKCGRPLEYTERRGIYCPNCGHRVTILCPQCGKRW
ncbi:DNA helicase PriA [Methanofollis tationis]|uniref:DNA helicase PriA n=2 Tax=Methanofollis TaxID=81416 RepID=A0A7K4HLN9_9EURY|nr:DNA helicase PriA [Methanofollis tationis]NVO66174.1 DNA helicase PriA [Methanofollis tationis]HDS62953.1 DNA helicase PriA [Methanofollis liminatans]